MTDTRHTRLAIAAGVVAGGAWLLNRRAQRQTVNDGVLDTAGVRRLYDRIASVYDIAASPYNLIGARRLAKQAIAELRLNLGDTVVDLGTGTGWNLPQLAAAVGANGTVIGVDISPGMLGQARKRIEGLGLVNVELVEADISTYQLSPDTNAVVSTFVIEMRPDYRNIIQRLTAALADNGRIATTGLRHPDRWPEWLIALGTGLVRIFGVSDAYRSHRPWEAIADHTTDSLYEESHAGVVYLAAGTTRRPSDTPGGRS